MAVQYTVPYVFLKMNPQVRIKCRRHQILKYYCYPYDKTIEMHQFLKFIIGIGLYMFLTVSLSIISSLALYTQQYIQVMLTAC